MVEAGAKEVHRGAGRRRRSKPAHAAIKQIVAAIDDLAKEAGKPEAAR